MKIKDRNIIEEKFHDSWAKTLDLDNIVVDKYFTAPTAIECQYALKLIGRLKGKKILDLGCGFGEASVWFASRGAKVVALDISAKMLNCVEVLAKRHKVEKFISRIKAAAEKIPLSSKSINLIFGGNILHHTNIAAVSKEVKRILKPKGKAIFIEPLAYNPIINIYRKMARNVRTEMEKPFTLKDIRILGSGFSGVSHKEFQLFTTLIFIWFFLGEGLYPSKVRYWKKFIEEGDKYAKVFKILQKIDTIVLKIPFLRRYCWNTVIELVK